MDDWESVRERASALTIFWSYFWLTLELAIRQHMRKVQHTKKSGKTDVLNLHFCAAANRQLFGALQSLSL